MHGIQGTSITPAPENPAPLPGPPDRSWPELIALALLITASSHAIPYWINALFARTSTHYVEIVTAIGGAKYYDLLYLAVGLLLTLPTPRRSGLILGNFTRPMWWIPVVCLVPVCLTAIVYSYFTSRPFEGGDASGWLISPLAQDLVFTGYLYGHFERRGKWRPFPKIPINLTRLLTAACFALWHVPNFTAMEPGYVAFQLAYVFVGTLWVGMTRVATGSMFYTVLVHMAVNYIAANPF